MVETLEAITDAHRALVFGIGGGGDVVSTIPTARFLELFGTEVTIGGATWIPVPRDVRPGPRSIDELEAIDRLEDRVAVVGPDSRTIDGVTLPEASIAGMVDNDVLALDISAGVEPLTASLTTVVDEIGFDVVIGIDAGGDVLAVGDEPGLRSPLTDAVGLGVLTRLPIDTLVGVHGFGSDGELTHVELTEAFADLASADALLGSWGITPAIRVELEAILEVVETEASRIPVEAAAGRFGERSIRGGRRLATASPSSMVTFFVDPTAVAARSTFVEPVAAAPTLEAAADTLRARGLSTEFDLEAERLDER